MDRERIIALSADLIASRKRTQELEAQLDLLLLNGNAHQAHNKTSEAPPPNNTAWTGSIDTRAKQVLARSGQPMSIDDVHGQMPDVLLTSLRAALYRLAKNQEIERTERGTYRAVRESA